MKFFTRAWHGGAHDDWTDEQYEAVGAEYLRHIASIAPKLPIELLALVMLDLHDGLFKDFSIDDSTSNVRMRLRCGDQQVGYYDVNLDYEGAAVVECEGSDLLGVVTDPKTEVLYDEVAITATDRFEHRLLLWPRGELVIGFDQLRLTKHLVATRDAP